MWRVVIAAVALATVIGTEAPAAAQNTTQPAQSCAAAVAKAQDNPLLRIQQYSGEGNRASINAYLQAAANAAKAGDEAKCWVFLRGAQQRG